MAAGEIQVAGVGLGNFLGLNEGGKIKVIAVSAPRRSPLVPDVMTFEEAGLGGYPQKGWWGLAAPAGTPKPIVDRLNAEFVRLFSDPIFVAFLDKQAVVAAPTSPDEFGVRARRPQACGGVVPPRQYAADGIQAGALRVAVHIWSHFLPENRYLLFRKMPRENSACVTTTT